MEEFYKVEYYGNLLKYKKIDYQMWTSKSLIVGDKFDEWKLKDEKNQHSIYSGISSFSDEYARNIKGFYPADKFEDAKKKSKELWDKIVAPGKKYKVVRYFDDVLDSCISQKPLSKKEAYDLATEYTEKTSNSHLYTFHAIPIE